MAEPRRPAAGRRAVALVTLAVPAACLAGTIHGLATEAFLRFEYARPGFPAAAGFTDAERLAAALPSTLFLVRPDPPSALAALRHAGRPLYAADEVAHLEDVRRLVRLVTALGWLGVVLLGAGGALWRRGRLPGYPGALARGGLVTVGLVGAVGAGIALAWPFVFTGFHRLFFPPGTWQFAPDSGLIRLFPGRFWYDTAVALSGLVAAEGLAVAVAGRALARRAA